MLSISIHFSNDYASLTGWKFIILAKLWAFWSEHVKRGAMGTHQWRDDYKRMQISRGKVSNEMQRINFMKINYWCYKETNQNFVAKLFLLENYMWVSRMSDEDFSWALQAFETGEKQTISFRKILESIFFTILLYRYWSKYSKYFQLLPKILHVQGAGTGGFDIMAVPILPIFFQPL